MKYCDNCKRVYESDIKFCPKCGKELVEPVRYDIFGEKMEETKEVKKETVEEINVDEKEPKINLKWYEKNIGEILAWISLGAFLIPAIGTIVSGIALIINASLKKKGFVILSIITLILSIGYFVLLYFTGTFNRLFQLV